MFIVVWLNLVKMRIKSHFFLFYPLILGGVTFQMLWGLVELEGEMHLLFSQKVNSALAETTISSDGFWNK